jgi:hypothetical protein
MMLNKKTILSLFVGVATVLTIVATTSTTTYADKSSGSNGLEKADEKVHENTPGGFGGHQDIKFHTGTCQGGHSTSDLDSIGGCSILSKPGH